MTRLAGWLVVLAVLYAAFWFWANRSVYYPMRYPAGWWEMRDRVGSRDVRLRTSDGVNLHAWWVEAPEARLATLFLHGNGGNLSHRIGHLRELVAAGTSVLILDYRGYGKSDGWPTEGGLYRDAEAGYDHLVRGGYTARSIVIHGESLGSSVAADLASRRECGAVVLEAPFTSAAAIAGRILPLLGPMVMRSFNTVSKLGGIRAPVLVIHGDRDEVIPFEMGERVYRAIAGPKEFWRVPGA